MVGNLRTYCKYFEILGGWTGHHKQMKTGNLIPEERYTWIYICTYIRTEHMYISILYIHIYLHIYIYAHIIYHYYYCHYNDLRWFTIISIRMHSYYHLYHYMIRELRRVPSITPRQKKRSSSHSHLIWPLKNRLPRH